MDYKCTVCGGELGWDPSIGKLRCKFCDSTFDLDQFDDSAHDHDHDHDHEHDHSHGPEPAPATKALDKGFDKATDDTTDVKEDLRLYRCSHCGAEVVTDKTTTATNCVFCNNPMILSDQMTGSFQPDLVIPFEVDKKQIEKLYEDYIRTKPFHPDEYSTANVIEKIKGVYLPFWLYNFQSSGDLQATGERTKTWTTRDWIITDHDVYDINRSGAMKFSKIPVIASDRTPRDAMDAIEPFDYSKLKKFNTGYLPGFLAERYNKDVSACSQAAHERANNTLSQELANTIGLYSNVVVKNQRIKNQNLGTQYTLLPAWMLFMDYKNGEDKLIAINGQTGKIVGNVPVDTGKRNAYFLRVFLIVFLVLFLFAIFVLL